LQQFYYKQLKTPILLLGNFVAHPAGFLGILAPAFLFICNCNDSVAIVVIRLVLVFIQV